MWKWLMPYLIKWAVEYCTPERISEWADKVLAVIVPWTRAKKDEFVAALRVEAAKSETPIDDMAVDALEKFLEALLPDSPPFSV